MTLTAAPVVEASKVRPRPKRRWPLLASGAAAVITAVAAALLVVDSTPAPDAFPPGIGGASSSLPVPVGETFLVALATELPRVTVLDAAPVTTGGSVAVASEVVACTPAPGMGLLGVGVADIQRWCSTQSVDGLDLSSLHEDSYLMLVLVPLAEGPVNVTGIDITYSDGSREVSQRIRADYSFVGASSHHVETD